MEAALGEMEETLSELTKLVATELKEKVEKTQRNNLKSVASIATVMSDTVNRCQQERKVDQWRLTRQVKALTLFSEELSSITIQNQVKKVGDIRRCRIAGRNF